MLYKTKKAKKVTLAKKTTLTTCGRKPKVPGSSQAPGYVQKCALFSNHPTVVQMSVKRVEVEELKKCPPPSPVVL